VRAALHHPALLQHEDLVGRADGAEAVRDDERRAPAAQPRERLLDERLALRVERAGGLVEDEDARVGQQRAGDGDALPLPAESRTPRSPTTVSYPSGKPRTNSSQLAWRRRPRSRRASRWGG
jgi:hypothetical protein